MMGEGEEPMEILDQLERGRIGVAEALRLLEEQPAEASSEQARRRPERAWGWLWLISFASGLVLTVLGGWLASLGGWWWLGPALLIGLPVMTVAAVSRDSAWFHLSVQHTRRHGPRRVAIHLPLPVNAAAWILRLAGPWIPRLDRTTIDELLVALEGSVSASRPITIEVDDDGSGERVQVNLG
jgi:MFS family permease